MKIRFGEIGPRSERYLACLETVHAHSGLRRGQGKLPFHMVVEVDQQDLETSLRGVWRTRKRLSERGEGRSIAD